MSDMLAKMFILVIGVNVMLFLGQAAILDTNPQGTRFYECQGNILAGYDQQNCTTGINYTLTTDSINQLPQDVTKVSGDNTGTSSLFTDLFSTFKNWFLQVTGLGYITGILSAPYTILSAWGLPPAFTWAIGSLWYGFTFIVIVMFLRGG